MVKCCNYLNKFFAILLLVLYTLSATELHQLLKLPILVEHYHEHQARTPKLSLGEFLWHHYACPDDHDGDKEKDNKLPFKSVCQSFSVFTVAPAQPTTFAARYWAIVYCVRKTGLPRNNSLIPTFCSTIWKPPRAV